MSKARLPHVETDSSGDDDGPKPRLVFRIRTRTPVKLLGGRKGANCNSALLVAAMFYSSSSSSSENSRASCTQQALHCTGACRLPELAPLTTISELNSFGPLFSLGRPAMEEQKPVSGDPRGGDAGLVPVRRGGVQRGDAPLPRRATRDGPALRLVQRRASP